MRSSRVSLVFIKYLDLFSFSYYILFGPLNCEAPNLLYSTLAKQLSLPTVGVVVGVVRGSSALHPTAPASVW
jgi:hypothetical protein